ncbi:MAG TPA: NAD-dependent epimerase/dehydratase family protein [Acetobacteraceae bacterium]|nr:NAD-dependent epimerase/dehydratase family protein [Acetobacteraceae bacterium]
MTDAAFTVLGAGGYVGSALVTALERIGCRVHAVTRSALPALLEGRRNAGHVIDCVGLTGDFRTRPHDTAEAHVSITALCLVGLRFDSFLFLSSTRVYARADATSEDIAVPATPADPSDLYNLTKLAGEALCLADPRLAVRVVRLSNVYGANPPADTFLGEVLAEGAATGTVHFRQSPQSSKDYISLAQVTRLLPAIALRGNQRLYNLAAGVNTTHAAIAAVLRRRLGWHVAFAPDAPTVRFRRIDTARLTKEFGAALSNLSADLPTLVANGQEVQCSPSMNAAAG